MIQLPPVPAWKDFYNSTVYDAALNAWKEVCEKAIAAERTKVETHHHHHATNLLRPQRPQMGPLRG